MIQCYGIGIRGDQFCRERADCFREVAQCLPQAAPRLTVLDTVPKQGCQTAERNRPPDIQAEIAQYPSRLPAARQSVASKTGGGTHNAEHMASDDRLGVSRLPQRGPVLLALSVFRRETELVA
jgi:hypothetical protein